MTHWTAKSQDGTTLSCRVTGKGSPLVLVHGAGNNSARWNPIAPLLEPSFCLYALDRRGRGESGDAVHYSLQREFEDVVSVVDAIGGPVNVLGHSLGAICALEATLGTKNIRRLILYEPPIPTKGPLSPKGMVDRIDALLRDGNRDGIVTTMMVELIGMSSKDVESLRHSPAWANRLAVAHTLPRELRAVDDYRFDSSRFRNLNIPTLLMLGEKSPPVFKTALEMLASALPHSRTSVLAGQRHIAIDTAPALFAHEILNFLKES